MTKEFAKRLILRFLSKIEKNGSTGCWMWQGGIDGAGYGMFWDGEKNIRVHRFMWELFVGPIPEGKHILHKCDTPACCNRRHLFMGTHLDNMKDKAVKGRAKFRYMCRSPIPYNIPLSTDYNNLDELSSHELGALGTL